MSGSDGAGGEGEPFSIVERVRFGDLDAMGHLNNVEFLRYFETARIAYIGEIAPGRSPTDRGEFGFIFAECKIVYRAPAFFGDELRIFIAPGELRRSSLRLEFRMACEGDGRLVADGYGVLVGYDYAAGRPQPLPDELRERVAPASAEATERSGLPGEPDSPAG